MAVTVVGNTISYNTDGVTTVFYFNYYLYQPSDLIVLYTAAGSATSQQLVLYEDYYLNGTPDVYGAYPDGIWIQTIQEGNVNSPFPLPSGGTLILTRKTEETQQIQYIDGDKFPATSHEHALDKLTLEIQDILQGFQGFLPAPPATGTPNINDWFIVYPAIAGTFFGYIYTTTGWKQFAPISF